MGEWNQTCMLTGLPIAIGEPCAGVLITQTPEKWSRIGPSKFFRPLSVAIYGDYDGYGGLENPHADPKIIEILNASGRFRCKNRWDRDGWEPFTGRDIKTWLRGLSEKSICYAGRDLSTPVYLALIKKSFFDEAVKATRDEYPDDEFSYMLRVLVREASETYGAMLSEPELETEARKLYLFDRYLDIMRRPWMPDAVGGQNSVESDLQVKFYRDVLAAAEEIRREFK